MTQELTPEEKPILKAERAKVWARVYAIILSPDWGEPDEPVIIAVRQRRHPSAAGHQVQTIQREIGVNDE